MSTKKRIVFHTGGPEFHPVARQALVIQQWLGDAYACEFHDGVDAFDQLENCDLLVLMGLHWDGMSDEWAGKLPYRAMQDTHKAALEKYITSGRPILCHHGAIASYPDWPRFAQLTGIAWVWGASSHSPVGTYTMRATDNHPVVAGLEQYEIEDEIYYALTLNADMQPQVHASVKYEGLERPMVITAEGGRIAGAGRMVYLANGHDMKAMVCTAYQRLWINSVNWLSHSDTHVHG